MNMTEIWIVVLQVVGIGFVIGFLLSIGLFFYRVWLYVNTPQQSAQIMIGKDASGITLTIDGGNVTFMTEKVTP